MHSRAIDLVGTSLFLLAFASSCNALPAATGVLTASRIAAGGNQTCVLEKEKAKCWGENDGGQLGDGTDENRNMPTDVTVLTDRISSLSVGSKHICALTTEGDVSCWGASWTGRLEGDTAGGYRAVAAGGYHTCLVTHAGQVQCWGGINDSMMGNGGEGGLGAPADVAGLGSGIQWISAGIEFSCVVQNGGAKCWGLNDTGQLGDGTYTNSLEPVTILGLESDVAAVAAGFFHACASKKNGEVWCWGENFSGELGDGTNQGSPVPVKVGGLEAGIRIVVVGGEHSCALTNAGGVKCWGNNARGQLGDGTTINRNTPVDVRGLTSGVIAIAVGGNHSCAVLNGGAVKCWGANDSGQLGNGTNKSSNTPVNVTPPAA